MAAGVEIIEDTASPAIRRIAVNASGRPAFAAAAAAVAEQIRQHLIAKDQIPNRLGGARTHFYSAAAGGTFWEAHANHGEVTIAKEGIAQRLLGGTIRPVNRKFLTIPVDPRGHGKMAPEFGAELRVVFFGATAKNPNTVGMLVLGDGPVSPVIYLLVKKVTQAPDPTVLPRDDEMREVAMEAIAEVILK